MAKRTIAVLDEAGNPLAHALSPEAREELIYAEAQRDLDLHRNEVREALERRTGVTTQELLKKARDAAAQANLQ